MGTSTTPSCFTLPSQRLSRALVCKREEISSLLAARGPSPFPPHRTFKAPDQLVLIKGHIEHYLLGYLYTEGEQALTPQNSRTPRPECTSGGHQTPLTAPLVCSPCG